MLMLTFAVLSVALVSTSAAPTPDIQRSAYDDFDEFQFQRPQIIRIEERSSEEPSGAEELPEWSYNPNRIVVSTRRLDRLGGNHLIRRRNFEDDTFSKRRIETLGGNNLVRRSLDSLGGNHLVKKNLDHLGGNYLVKRVLDRLGGNFPVKNILEENGPVKRGLDRLGGNFLIKKSGSENGVEQSVGDLEDFSVVRKSLDTLGGSHLIKRSDEKGHFIDRLGGGYLLKRSGPRKLYEFVHDASQNDSQDDSEPVYYLRLFQYPINIRDAIDLIANPRFRNKSDVDNTTQ